MIRVPRSVFVVTAGGGLAACSLFADLGGLAGAQRLGDGGSEGAEAGPVDSGAPTPPDADRDVTPPCTAETSSDPLNCGRCGHSCLAGACTAGVCQPFTMATETEPFGLATDGTWLYWNRRDAGIIRAKNLTSGAVRDVATGLGTGLGYMTIRGAVVYFVERQSSRILSVATAGGTPTAVIGGLTLPEGLAWSEALGRLIWTERGGTIGLKSARPDGTAVAPFLALVTNPEDVEVDGDDVFIADEGADALLRVSGGVTSKIADVPDVVGIAVDSGYFYCTEQDFGRVVRVPRTGAPVPETLVSGQAFPSGIVSTANAIYWTNLTGSTVMGLAK